MGHHYQTWLTVVGKCLRCLSRLGQVPTCVWRANLKRGWQRTSSSSWWSLLWLHPHWLKTGRRRTQRSWRHLSGTATCLKIKTRENVRGWCSQQGRKGRSHEDTQLEPPLPPKGDHGDRKPAGIVLPGSWEAPVLFSSPSLLLKQERMGAVRERGRGKKRKKKKREKEKRKKGWLKGCFFYLMLKGQQTKFPRPQLGKY